MIPDGNAQHEEDWRAIPGFTGYEVNACGDVRSWRPCTRTKTLPYMRKPYLDKTTGYLVVSLMGDNGKQAVRRLHRLVGEAFLGPQPESMGTRHLNGIKTDNRVENLVYGTWSENGHDAVAHGENWLANKTHCPQGHPYSESNTRLVRVKGKFRFRACKRCEADYQSRRRARQRQERAA